MNSYRKQIRNGILYVIMLTFIITTALSINVIPVYGYVSSMGNVTGYSTSGDILYLTLDNGGEPSDDKLDITVLDDNVLKVNYRPNNASASDDTPMLDSNATWGAVTSNIDISGNPIVITTSAMQIDIEKFPCRMTVKDADGTTLFWEADTTTSGAYYNGVRFVHTDGDNLYGVHSYDFLGGTGDILRNDCSETIEPGYQGNGGAPLIWSTSGYAVLFDTDGGYSYTNSAQDKLEMYYGSYSKRRYSKTDVEYYIILGTPKEIMEGVKEITGKAPMSPKWALGFINHEWNLDQDELIEMVDTYRAKNIPIDAYALDYDWKKWGEDNYGEFTWNTTNFPASGSTSLVSTMSAKGINMAGIMKPRIVVEVDGNTTTQASYAAANNLWYPGGSQYDDYWLGLPVRDLDFYSTTCRSWYWDHLEDAYDKGIAGFWNDETGRVQSGAYDFWFGPFQGLHMQQAIYEGQTNYSTERVWSTNRVFYLGAQRYGYTHWSGDIGGYFTNAGSDAGMKEQRSRMLSIINIGQSKWGMDIGGFNPSSSNPSPELLTRWYQFGAFVPVFRAHGNNYQQRQPWYYGNSAEEVAKQAFHLRYKLFPYVYSYERSEYDTGVGLVRPLMFDYPSDSSVSNYVDAWMFGDYLIAAPVVDETDTLKDIYLPSGTWTDYFRGIEYTGGSTIQYPINAEAWTDIPLFINEGAIIPSQKVLNYVSESSISLVYVDVFPCTTESSFTYYDDHGNNYNYEGSTYFKQTLSTQDNGSNQIDFDVVGKTGSYSPASFYYLAKIHGTCATNVTMGGVSLTTKAGLSELENYAGEAYSTGKDVYGDVTYVKISGASATTKSAMLSGHSDSTDNSFKYEAELASLWGASTTSMAAVNTNHNNYSGSGFVDGFDNAEAAVTFYPSVKVGGDYDIGIRYANDTGSTKEISVFVNGSRLTEAALSDQADWDTWATKTVRVPLSAGNNMLTLRYYADAGDTGNVNIDYITVPFEPEVAKYEVESGELSGGVVVDRDHYFYTGVGFVDGITSTGAECEFTVYTTTSGVHSAALRYANASGSTKTMSVYVNGTDLTQASFPNLTDWNTWSDCSLSLTLTQGANTIAFKYDAADSGNINVDRLLVKNGTISGTMASERNELDNGGFERLSGYSDNWTEWHPGEQSLAYGVDSGSGSNPPESPWVGDKRAYFWLESSYQQSIHQQVSVSNGTYLFEAWVRMKNTTPTTARAEITNHGSAQINVNISNTGEWEYISQQFTVTSGTVDIGFYVNSPGGTTLHIDDVRVTKLY